VLRGILYFTYFDEIEDVSFPLKVVVKARLWKTVESGTGGCG